MTTRANMNIHRSLHPASQSEKQHGKMASIYANLLINLSEEDVPGTSFAYL